MMDSECFHCNRPFTNRSNLIRHIRTVHADSTNYEPNHGSKGTYSFECFLCNHIFKNRSNIIRHLRTVHVNPADNSLNYKPEGTHSFECSHCGHVFKNRVVLKRHLRKSHSNPTDNPLKDSNSLECSKCRHVFRRKSNLLKHLRRFCEDQVENFPMRKKTNAVVGFKCVECHSLFHKRDLLEEHYNVAHNVAMVPEILQFPSFSDFNQWKLNIQRETVVSFINQNSWNTLTHTTKLYTCHRSGFYKEKCKSTKRKRFLKQYGSKKIQGHCPARITVKINNADGTCAVDYLSTHMGHLIRNKQELRHIYVNQEEKINLAAKIQEDITVQESKLRKCIKSSEENDRLQILPFIDVDVHNITLKSCALDDDEADVEAFVVENKDAILFYKPQNAEDDLNIFNREDFVLMFMNEEQERNLRRYGHKIICFDGTPGTNENNFMLHTLLVLDLNGEGVPVAFVISNRDDQLTIDVLLTCIRDRIGIISPKCFMSDMQTTYINSWHSIMGQVQHHLYCPWHVREAWRRNLIKIKDKNKRHFIQNLLYELANELNIMAFEEKLKEFLLLVHNKEYDSEAVKTFMEYFCKKYVDNGLKSCWAYCFQKEAGINTNMFLESFHKNLKCGIGKGRIIKQLRDALQIILDFIQSKETADEIKEIRGKSSHKLRILRDRHHKAEKFLEENLMEDVVIVIDENTWLVQSAEDRNKSYTVKKEDTKECILYTDVNCELSCSICQMCFHEYSCDCFDAIIRNNMCKHVHIIGLFLQKLSSMDDGCAADNQVSDEETFTILNAPFDMNLNQNYIMDEYNQGTTWIQVKEQSIDNSDNDAPPSKYQAEIQKAHGLLEKAFAQTQNPEIILEITKKYIAPLESFVRTMNGQADQK